MKKILAAILTLAVVMVFVAAMPMLAITVTADTDWAGFRPISTSEGLRMMEGSSDNFYLTQDIDLGNWGVWQPIGSWERPFRGTFDGNGFVIKNMTTTNGGLFSNVEFATIRNLGLVNVNVRNDGPAGAFVNAFNRGLLIENCFVTGSVTARRNAAGFVGGRLNEIGLSSEGHVRIKNCLNLASVTSEFGGAFGINGSEGGGFENIINGGTIIGSANATNRPPTYVAGVTASIDSQMISCYSYGNITNNFNNVIGGLVGAATRNSYMRNCATTQSVTIANPDYNSIAEARTNVPLPVRFS